ncbi:MAG: O-antigen ligase family protein [Lentisphaerae bacterium]|nr:O-antigen ligase family protein [Lentisphaerota bacterium]
MTFFLTSVFMVMVFWRPQEWLFPWLFGLPLLDAVVYGSMLAMMLESQANRIRFPSSNHSIVLLGMLWFAAIMSHVVNGYFAGVQFAMREVFKVCFFSVLLVVVLDRESRLRVVGSMFVVMACMMALHAILQIRRGYGFAGLPPFWQPPSETRAGCWRSLFFGIFGDPNDLAQILATAMPFVFAIPRRMSFFPFLLCAAVVWFLWMGFETTHSRGGMIAVTVIAVTCILLKLPRSWQPWLLAAGAGLVLVLCGTKGGALLDMSARERVIFWGYGNWAFKAKPIFGIGYEMFWQVGAGRPAHNAFVTCYTEMGLFGYIPWFALLQGGMVGSWRSYHALNGVTDPAAVYLRRFTYAAMAAAAGFLGSAYFLSRTFVFPLFFMVAIMAAIPEVAAKHLPADHPPLLDWRRDVLVMGSAGAVSSIAYVYFSIIMLNRFA